MILGISAAYILFFERGLAMTIPRMALIAITSANASAYEGNETGFLVIEAFCLGFTARADIGFI